MKISSFVFLLFTFFAISCQKADEVPPTSAVITGKVTNASDDDEIKIVAHQVLGDPVELASTTLNTEGIFSLRFDLAQPTDATITIGRESSAMYLMPGDSLMVTVDLEQFDETITYEGEGAAKNNYLAQKYLVEEQFNEELDESIYRLEQDEFIAEVNDLKNKLQSHLDESVSLHDLPEGFVRTERISIMADWANSMENYPTYYGYYTGNRDFVVEESFYAFRDKFDPNNPDGIASGSFRSYIDGWTSRKIGEMMEKNEKLQDDWTAAYGEAYQMLRDEDELQGEVKEYALANHLQNYISYLGTDGVDPWMEDFTSSYPESPYSVTLQSSYDKWAKLAQGQPAPDFTYPSIEGKTVSFSDFRGKVVYLDVWATWCGPCKAEMPAAKKLKKNFADNEDVVFMYVSIDEDKDKWEQFLENDPEFTGVHLIANEGWKSDFTDAYLINSIPRYILVDQDGEIVSASAPRPSSGEVIEEMISGLFEDTSEPAAGPAG